MFKEPRFIVSFFNRDEAMAFKEACEKRSVDGRLIPIPSQIAAGCGMVWSSPLTARASLMAVMDDPSINYSERMILEL